MIRQEKSCLLRLTSKGELIEGECTPNEIDLYVKLKKLVDVLNKFQEIYPAIEIPLLKVLYGENEDKEYD